MYVSDSWADTVVRGTLAVLFFSVSVCVLVRFTSLFATFISREGNMRSPQAFLPAALSCTVITHPGPHRQLASQKALPVSLTHIFSYFVHHVLCCCSLAFCYGISLFNSALARKYKRLITFCHNAIEHFIFITLNPQENPKDKPSVPQIWAVTFLYLCLGLPGGMTRSTHSSSSSDIKREDKEDDENSVGDKSEDDKKDSKAARSRRWVVFSHFSEILLCIVF